MPSAASGVGRRRYPPRVRPSHGATHTGGTMLQNGPSE
jgi:hypothetical protein